MRGKLIRHEFTETYHVMLPLYAAIILSAGAGRLLNLFAASKESPALLAVCNLIAMLIDIIMTLGIFLTLFVAAKRVYSPMVTSNDSVSFCSEASVRANLTARLLVSMIWSAGTLVFITLGYWLYFWALPYYVRIFFYTGLGFWGELMAALIILLAALMVICALYLSVAIGGLSKKQPLGLSIISGVGVFGVLGAACYFLFRYSLLDKAFAFIGKGFITFMQTYGVFAVIISAVFSVVCFEPANAILGSRRKAAKKMDEIKN